MNIYLDPILKSTLFTKSWNARLFIAISALKLIENDNKSENVS